MIWPLDDPAGTQPWDPGAPTDEDRELERLATMADEQIDEENGSHGVVD